MALEFAGHKVVHAKAAQAAVELADEQAPDAVILELQLPAHNGLEFLYELRSYPEWAHIPVIINSFMPPQELARFSPALMSELGICATLYKPRATLQQLQRSVREALAAAKPAVPAAEMSRPSQLSLAQEKSP